MTDHCMIIGCKSSSRALCHCCKQDLCRFHLNEHDDQLQNRIYPLADELNILTEHVNTQQLHHLLAGVRESLEAWKRMEHERIDHIADEKYEELEKSVEETWKRESEKLTTLAKSIRKMHESQAATAEELNRISGALEEIKWELKQMEEKYRDVDIETIFPDLVGDPKPEKNIDLNNLVNPIHTIIRSSESSKAMASNDHFLLIHQDNRLCLLNRKLEIVNQIQWQYNWIWDMCWSSTVSKFFIVTLNEIFILDDKTMFLEMLTVSERFTYTSCTCSKKSLYVATNELASNVLEFDLRNHLQLIKRWQNSDLCRFNERIQDMVYHKGTIAFIIENQTSNTKRMELRTASNFARIWTLPFDLVDPLHNAFRLSLFNQNEWLMVDWRTSQMFHISKDGQVKSTCTYHPLPFRTCQFGSDLVAVSTKTSINFHQL